MDTGGGYRVTAEKLPELYPTQFHSAEFWEILGRTVGTFGFLENVLGRAIFAFTGTRDYSESELQAALEAWLPQLEKAMSDTLYPLIESYAKAVRQHQHQTPIDFDDLVADLKNVAELRNVLCHGFWSPPDANGATVPFYMRSRDKQVFNDPIDINYLRRVQRSVTALAIAVVDSVTAMGVQFPGSGGPGKPLIESV
ncbi:hypothetical protein HJB67_22400 [Rhizobium lentis]|uniref:hypothetical protein n=1 Tax=Rhizobium lentis TaxID=1138194 RepID=UPI001C83F4C0|nr:hypothetical protein [Rhizobium lentis]MBX5012691.1 hypothetical protein [Rhizobium lentis]